MDNPSRSERTRKAALEAALVIIARDGPGKLTLDAIAREAGMSKGGLMHQFPTKQAVLKALLEHQVAHFEAMHGRYIAEHGATLAQPQLSAQIATLRAAAMQPHSITVAFLGALADEPALLSISRDRDAERVEAIKAEAGDPELAMLRRAAAQGLALSTIFGISAMPAKERSRLFDLLLDDEYWSALAKPKKRPAARARASAKSR
jgi:AcrR family transcriptional regulator